MLGIGTFRRVAGELRRDVRAAQERDPAAKGITSAEILAGWPGVHALLSHRVAHALDAAGVPLAPRALAYASRALTGIEIHPAARVGDALFIDHGMGVVIGETAEVGENVTMYQGVTLGGTGFATGKRHPTVQANVTIGSGAKLLGPITIGHGAKIGANAVVIHDVPPNSTVVGNPGHPCPRRRTPPRGAGRRLGPPAGPDRRRAQAALRPHRRARTRARDPARRGPQRSGGRPAAPDPRPESRRWLASRTASSLRGRPPRPSRWLLEADKVPQWTSHLKTYEPHGSVGQGARIRQVLEVSGRIIDVELEVTGYQPPTGAETRFSTNGIDVVSGYALEASGAGSRLTQTIEAKARSLGARLIVPVVQPRLEEKLTEDLERLRETLAGVTMRAGLLAVLLALAFAPAALAQDVADPEVDALRTDSVYVAPGADDILSAEAADAVRARIDASGEPIRVAVLPEGNAEARGRSARRGRRPGRHVRRHRGQPDRRGPVFGGRTARPRRPRRRAATPRPC